jgi:hypothetical protein
MIPICVRGSGANGEGGPISGHGDTPATPLHFRPISLPATRSREREGKTTNASITYPRLAEPLFLPVQSIPFRLALPSSSLHSLSSLSLPTAPPAGESGRARVRGFRGAEQALKEFAEDVGEDGEGEGWRAPDEGDTGGGVCREDLGLAAGGTGTLRDEGEEGAKEQRMAPKRKEEAERDVSAEPIAPSTDAFRPLPLLTPPRLGLAPMWKEENRPPPFPPSLNLHALCVNCFLLPASATAYRACVRWRGAGGSVGGGIACLLRPTTTTSLPFPDGSLGERTSLWTAPSTRMRTGCRPEGDAYANRGGATVRVLVDHTLCLSVRPSLLGGRRRRACTSA